MRILVIDDDATIRRLAVRMLERAGHEAESAESGATGITAFREDDGGFDAVILDMSLGDMSGLECLAELAEIRKDIPVVVSTGQDIDLLHFPESVRGHVSLLPKPYRGSEFVSIVERALTVNSRD